MDSLTNRVDDFAEPRLWESRPGVKTFSLASILGPQIGHPHIPFCSSSEKKLIESIEVRERITNACKSYGGSLLSQCT